MHITKLDITALGDLPVHSSCSTILFIKLLHSSLGASVRIIIQKTDLVPLRASTKKQPPSVDLEARINAPSSLGVRYSHRWSVPVTPILLEHLDHRIILGALRRFLQSAIYVGSIRATP